MSNLLVLDLDGTLTKRDSLIDFSLYMLREKRNPRYLIVIILLILLKAKVISNIRFKTLYSYLLFKNVYVEHLKSLANDYVASPAFKKNVNNDVIEFIENLGPAEPIIVSGNYSFLVEAIAPELNIKLFAAAILGESNGKYNGTITGIIPYGVNKVHVFNEMIEKGKYLKLIGLGDQESDLPLLRQMDEAYLVKYSGKENKTYFRSSI